MLPMLFACGKIDSTASIKSASNAPSGILTSATSLQTQSNDSAFSIVGKWTLVSGSMKVINKLTEFPVQGGDANYGTHEFSINGIWEMSFFDGTTRTASYGYNNATQEIMFGSDGYNGKFGNGFITLFSSYEITVTILNEDNNLVVFHLIRP